MATSFWAVPRASKASAACFASWTKRIASTGARLALKRPGAPAGPAPIGGYSRAGGNSRPRPVSPQRDASDADQHRQVLEAEAPPSLLVDADGQYCAHLRDGQPLLAISRRLAKPESLPGDPAGTAPRAAHDALPGTGETTKRRQCTAAGGDSRDEDAPPGAALYHPGQPRAGAPWRWWCFSRSACPSQNPVCPRPWLQRGRPAAAPDGRGTRDDKDAASGHPRKRRDAAGRAQSRQRGVAVDQ